jgi:hypothetical protein
MKFDNNIYNILLIPNFIQNPGMKHADGETYDLPIMHSVYAVQERIEIYP